MKLYKKGVAIVILLLFLLSNAASAYYIPAEHMQEAKQIKDVVGWYNFGMKYADEHFGFDILRQMAQNETNSGKIAELHIVMKKYLKVGG